MAKQQRKHNESYYRHMVHYVHNYPKPIAMILFFIFLFLSFFMPHNQEIFLEFYWASVLLFLLGFRIFIQQKMLVLPRTFLLLWGAVILALLTTTATSRSIANSLVTNLRYIEGAVIFFLVIDNRAYHENTRTFMSALLTTGKAALYIFFLLICFPFFSEYIPSYNGIVAANGHHPIAYMLIALLPVVVLVPTHGVRSNAQNIFIFLALVLSAARGAWIVAAAFLTTRIKKSKDTCSQFFIFMVLGVLTAAFLLMFWLSLLPYEQKLKLTQEYPKLAMFAKESNHSLRFMYIQETISALQDKPFLGHGPGTFHLLSRQYAQSQISYARYAHSLPFETLAENGVMGTIPIAVLFGVIFIALLSIIRTSKNIPHVALAWGALLLILYSTIEVTLNNLSIWLLFWAITGHVIPYTSLTTRRISEIVSIIVFLVLLAFIASYATAHTLAHSLTLTQSVRIAPYFKSNILRLIYESNSQETNRLIPIMLTWYNQDPDIYHALARSSNPITAEKYYEKALRFHPYNNGYLKEYLTLLINNNDKQQFGDAICHFSQLHRELSSGELCMYLRSDAFAHYSNSGALYAVLDYLQGTDGKAKFYYFLGLSVFQEQQDTVGATLLWQAARDIAPEWGFYHLELASAYYYWHNNEERANTALSVCEKNAYAKTGCKNAISNLTELLEPGLRAPDISAIPTILPQ